MQLKNALPNGIVIKNGLLRSLPHNFNPTVAKNFPGYEYAICKNIGRSTSPSPNWHEIFNKGTP
jgi:hypothetical protein